MSKECIGVKAEDIPEILYEVYDVPSGICEYIKQTIHRLKAIDNAEPSEALECLNQFINEMTRCLENPKQYAKNYAKEIFYKYKNTFESTIKQALLKAQEQEKFFDDKLVFKNGCIMSGFDYKGKQIVAMPLEEYDEFIKQEKAQELKSENSALLEENKDLYVELAFAEKQYKELTECVKQYKKVLDIIKKKKVNILLLELAENVDEYNERIVPNGKLIEEEYNLLKEMVEE